MKNLRKVAALALAAQLLVPAWLQAGETSIVDAAALEAAVTQHAREDQVARQRVATLLQRPEVRALAQEHGLDLVRAQNAIATLDGEELRTLDAMAATYDAQLAGGGINKNYVIWGLAAIGAVVILLAVLD